MVADNQETRPVRRRRAIVWIVCGAALAAPFILLFPALQHARDEARRMSSGNNLKQIAISLHNYHDVYECLPAGGTFREDGAGMRGWPTILVPYLEIAMIWGVDEDPLLPWDDPQNVDIFRQHRFKTYLVPGVAEQETPDGIPLIHYAANEWLMHRNSAVTLDEIGSKSGTLMVGDAFGEFRPWADVFNWRDATVPLRTSPRQFGSTIRKTTLAAMGDGSVASLGPTIDEEVFARLAGPAELRPSAALVARPTEPYRLRIRDYWRYLGCAEGNSGRAKGGDRVRFKLSPDCRYLEGNFEDMCPESGSPSLGMWGKRYEPFVKSKPIEHVKISGALDVTELEPFLAIPTLKRLSIGDAVIQGNKEAVLGQARRTIEID